ncbi:MAG: YheU family protein [Pseudomonadota bacterium]
MIIPHQKLSPEALNGLIEEFVTRHGSDTGYTQATLEENVAMIMRQLERGDVFIVFDERQEAANIVPKERVKSFLHDDMTSQ